MTGRQIEVHQFQQMGANGDRATVQTPYFSYKVVLVDGKETKFEFREWTGYDNFMVHILPDSWKEAEQYAQKLAEAQGLPYGGVVSHVRKTQFKEWWVRAK